MINYEEYKIQNIISFLLAFEFNEQFNKDGLTEKDYEFREKLFIELMKKAIEKTFNVIED